MNIRPIIIISGEPYGIFNEIFLKVKKKNFFKKPIILIGSKKILLKQNNKIKHNFKLNLLNIKDIRIDKLKKDKLTINLIDVDLSLKEKNKAIRNYIEKCFKIGLNIISKYRCAGLINGPVNKKTFLNYKYPGVTEYLAKKIKVKKFAMLIYSENLSVCPITTHLPLKNIHKSISKRNIILQCLLYNRLG